MTTKRMFQEAMTLVRMTQDEFINDSPVTDRERRLCTGLHQEIDDNAKFFPGDSDIIAHQIRLKQAICGVVERQLRGSMDGKQYRSGLKRIAEKIGGLSSVFAKAHMDTPVGEQETNVKFAAMRTIEPEHVCRNADMPLLASDGEIARIEKLVRKEQAMTREELLWLLRSNAPGKAFGMGHMLTSNRGIIGYWAGLKDLEHGAERRSTAMRIDTIAVAPGFEHAGVAEELCRDILETSHWADAILDGTDRKRP